MQLHEIMAGFEVDPERERQLAKKMCQSLRGRVRMNPAFRLCMLWVFVFWTLSMLVHCSNNPGLHSMLLMIVTLPIGFVVAWYVMTWELTFDGETGFMSYHTLLRGTIRFHVSEITSIRKKGSNSTKYDPRMLLLSVGETNIRIMLSDNLHNSMGAGMFSGGGYVDGNKLEQYLDFYQKMISGTEASLIREGVDPRIAAAIASAKIEAEQEIPEKPAPEKVCLKKETSDTSILQPAASEIGKPEVDVDALFRSVLQQYGKDSKKR